jgi:hypothetical protein
VYFEKEQMGCNFLGKNKWAAWTLHYLFTQPSKFVFFEKVQMGCSFLEKNKWAAWTLHYFFTQPSKWTLNSKKMG